jgi:hypothetical protein
VWVHVCLQASVRVCACPCLCARTCKHSVRALARVWPPALLFRTCAIASGAAAPRARTHQYPAVSGNGVSMHSPKAWIDILSSPNAPACIALDCIALDWMVPLQLLAAATARGTTIVVAAGDGGAHGRTDDACQHKDTRPDFPASSPYAAQARRADAVVPFFSCRFTGSLGAGIAISGAGIAINRCRYCD